MSAPFKMKPGRGQMPKTGRGIPSGLRQDGFGSTLAKIGRTALALGKTTGNQLLDFIQPDANKYGGEGSRESKFKARAEKGRENASHQSVVDDAKKGKIYNFAGELAKFHQDTGYSKSGYDSDKEYNTQIQEQVKSHRKNEENNKGPAQKTFKKAFPSAQTLPGKEPVKKKKIEKKITKKSIVDDLELYKNKK